MKSYFVLAVASVSFLTAAPTQVPAEPPPVSLIYETPHEFFGSADFDGDGLLDLVIVDKESGKYRLGYQSASGLVNWVDCRPSGMKGIAGLSIGKVLEAKRDGLAFCSPDANQVALVEVSSPTAPGKPVTVPFTAGLGPNTIVAVDIGGAGKTPLADLYVGSIYNSPDPNQANLLRNDGGQFPKLGDITLPGPAVRGNRLSLKAGQPELLALLVNDDKGGVFRVEDFGSGKPVAVATVTGLPAGSDYAAGNFRGSALREFIFYKPGANNMTVRPVEEPAPGQFQFGKGESFDLGQPIRRVITLSETSGQQLFVIFGEGEKAGVFDFDGTKAPVLVQAFAATNNLFTCAASVPGGFVVFSQPTGGKFSTRYQSYKASGKNYTPGAFGGLASLADNDNITIPDIHARIVANLKVKEEGEMKPYTNTIPGTQVSYAMVPIPGGEFVMGSPETEKARKPDEGPQHKVRVTPFWMGQCEVTWNEYELFMYPDEELRIRATVPTDAAGDKLADAVTHPSKPYVEMSFGMGKDGYPAISMTQHGANKYCQWLSAKTGHFYRLPTEAEWEYACRAGTSTTYWWGSDTAGFSQHVYYPTYNSGTTTTSVASTLPNAFGLYDMQGNGWKWCNDWFSLTYYASSPAADPRGPATGVNRVLRGGADIGSLFVLQDFYRSAYRGNLTPGVANMYTGFTCARSR